ncbi:hypothetical protein QPL79_08365 [Ignisphaera sp. 4213-co]|uniref:Uncharacterized protein n=1 Tax=Ignisphaera cupida TaxID=3050454 RepID=A0ABD4Z9K1_9CREN|nr:hypothetical protein [Ignisphaera sp. 4213-co]MDK6029374.1 hypothetical protein [Ignisphaera sp. 4213-co]
MLEIVYFIAALGSIPILSLVAINVRNRRYWHGVVPGVGAIASLIVFVLVFAAPWIVLKSYAYTLNESYRVVGIAGDVFSKSLLLTSIFAAFGAALWLADIESGKEVFLSTSAIGFAITLSFISSATALALLGNMAIESIGYGAWASTALYSLNIVLGMARKKPRQFTQPISYSNASENDLAKKILEEAKKAISR